MNKQYVKVETKSINNLVPKKEALDMASSCLMIGSLFGFLVGVPLGVIVVLILSEM